MKPRTLAVLALLVGGLAAFIGFYERELPGSETRKQRAGRALPFEADQLVALDIDWQGRSLRLERTDTPAAQDEGDAAPAPATPPAEWRLVAPFAARADRAAVERLAGDLARLEVTRTLSGAERKDVGLEPPRGKLVWRTKQGEGTLEIGGQVPASQNVVVAASTRDGLAVVPGWFVADLDKPAGDWRAREALDVAREAIERLRVVPAGAPAIELVRGATGFALAAPFADMADRDRVDPLISDLTALRIEKFLDPPLAPEAAAGLAALVGRIEIGVAGRAQPQAIEVGGEVAPGGNRYLRLGEQAFEAKTALAEALQRPAAEWRSRNWASFESFRIERLRVEDGQGKVELVRDGADWKRDGARIPYPEVGDLLYALTSARAERVIPASEAAAYPAASPALTLTLVDGDGHEELLTLGAPRPEGVPARVAGRDVVLLLPGRAADEVTGKIAAIRAVQPLPSAAAEEGEKAAPQKR